MKLNDYTVPAHGLKVRGQMPYESDPLGGQTSGTARAHKGIKAKQLFVSLVIKFEDGNTLRELMDVAVATDSSGALVVYDLQDHTGNSMKIKRVQFSEVFTVEEQKNNRAWDVSFVLYEYHSVPEQSEQRMDTANAPDQSASGETVAAAGESEGEGGAGTGTDKKDLFHTVLKKLDDYLADDKPENAA